MLSNGWLLRYLVIRSQSELKLPESFSVLNEVPSDLEHGEHLLYLTSHETGIIYGCPLILDWNLKQWPLCKFPMPYDRAIFIFLETLFTLATHEMTQRGIDAGQPVRQMMRVLKGMHVYYCDPIESVFNEHWLVRDDIPVDEQFRYTTAKLEQALFQILKLSHFSFMVDTPLQNVFAFLELHWFLKCLRENEYKLTGQIAPFHKSITRQKEQLLKMFIGIIWADQILAKVEKKVVGRYVTQARLPRSVKLRLRTYLEDGIELEDIDFSVFGDPLPKYYVLELCILLSLIDNQQAPQELALIEQFAHKMGVSEQQLDLLYVTVGQFFELHVNDFEFLTRNTAVKQMRNYTQDRLLVTVKKNKDALLKEVRETQELYDLIIKSARESLNAEEKRKVREQLTDIAKTIPAFAIFLLPAGPFMLVVLHKFLKVNLLPSSFSEEDEQFKF